MKYRLTVYRKVIIEDVYEMEVPDSVLAEMAIENGNPNGIDLYDYISSETKPIRSEEIKDIDWDYEIDEIGEQT